MCLIIPPTAAHSWAGDVIGNAVRIMDGTPQGA